VQGSLRSTTALLNREPCENHGLTGNCKATYPIPNGNTDLTIDVTISPLWDGKALSWAKPGDLPFIKFLFGAFPDKVQAKINYYYFSYKKSKGVFDSCRAVLITF